MYKILIRNRELDEDESIVTRYSFYLENDKDYETSNLSEALTKMNDLLDTYLRKDILLVDYLITNSEVFSNKLEVVAVLGSLAKIINDGTNFKFELDLSSLEQYTIVNINTVMYQEIKTYLETLGLTNVTLQPDFSIVANNPTGKAVEGRLDIEKGLYVLYSRETGTSNYITSDFSTTLEEKGPTPGPGPEPEDDPVFVDVFIVDENGEPLVVDKLNLFNRGCHARDFEVQNVHDFHATSLNGNYLIMVQKLGYEFDPYYEKVFRGKERNEDPITIIGRLMEGTPDGNEVEY